jgi:hypothetical protein
MEKKICSKCKEEKEFCEFNKRKDSKDGHRNECKICWYLKSQNYIKKFPQKKQEYNNKWFSKNTSYYKQYYKNNEKKFLEYKIKFNGLNPDYNKNYYVNNKDYFSDYVMFKYVNNNLFRLSHIIRNRIRTFLKLKNLTKTNKTFDIVGCSPEFLKEHLEQQFTEGMSWGNQGLYGWHIDHKIPLSSSNTEEEIYKLCHYTNLQPLWAEDNLKKSNKIIN